MTVHDELGRHAGVLPKNRVAISVFWFAGTDNRHTYGTLVMIMYIFLEVE